MDDFDIAVDDDLSALVEQGKLDPWKAGQCQLRRDVAVLQKKMQEREESETTQNLTVRARESG